MTVGAPEVPSALERGVVDGVFTANAGGGKVWKDLLKYCYEIGLNFFDATIVVNKEAFEKLPADLSAKLAHQGGGRARALDDAETAHDEGEEKPSARPSGMIQTAATPDDASAAPRHGEPYWDEWAKARARETAEALERCARRWAADAGARRTAVRSRPIERISLWLSSAA